MRSGWKVVIFHVAAIAGLLINAVLLILPLALLVLVLKLGQSSGPMILLSMCSYFGVFLAAALCGRFLDGALLHSGMGGPAKRSSLEFFGGAALGAALNLGGLFMLWLATFAVEDASVHIALTSNLRGLVSIPFWLVGLTFAAAFEEVFFRGYGFAWAGRMVGNVLNMAGLGNRTAQRLGRIPVVLLSSMIFALMHMGNPGQSGWIPQIATFVAGLWLAMAVYRTGALWFAIGLHWAWNSTMGLLLGVRLSGLAPPSILETTLTGPDWLTGGGYGLEGSVFGIAAFGLGIFAIMACPRRPDEQTIEALVIRD